MGSWVLIRESWYEIEVEPEWLGDSKRPDAITDSLISGVTTAVEIAATNDNSLSGEADMDAIALQISEAANRSEPGSGDYLYYHYREPRPCGRI